MQTVIIIGLIIWIVKLKINVSGLKSENENLRYHNNKLKKLIKDANIEEKPDIDVSVPRSVPINQNGYDMSYMHSAYSAASERHSVDTSGIKPMFSDEEHKKQSNTAESARQIQPVPELHADKTFETAESVRMNENAVSLNDEKTKPVSDISSETKTKETANNTASQPRKAPVYGYDTAYDKPVKTVNTANVILILGAMFVTLAGVIFINAEWWSMGNALRAILLFSFSVLFFTIHYIADKKLELISTGKAFFALGSVFFPAAMAACGIFGLFGQWLSFSGEGAALLCALTAASIGGISYGAVRTYNSPAAALSSLSAFSAAICGILVQLMPTSGAAALAVSVYSLIIVLTAPRISEKADKYFLGKYNSFVLINTCIISATDVIFSGSGITAFIGCTVAAAAFLDGRFTGKNTYFSVLPFTVLAAAASYKLFTPYSYGEMTFATVAVITAVLSCMEFFEDDHRRLFGTISLMASIPTMLINFFCFMSSAEPVYSWAYVASTAVMTMVMIVMAVRGNSIMRYMSVPSLVMLSYQFSSFLSGDKGTALAVSGVFIVCIFFVFSRFKKLRSSFSDWFFTLSAYFSGLFADILFCDTMPMQVTALAVIASAVGMAIYSGRSGNENSAPLQYLTVPFVSSLFVPAAGPVAFGDTVIQISLIMWTVVYAVLAFTDRSPEYRRYIFFGTQFSSIICFILTIDSMVFPSVYMWISAAGCFLLAYSNKDTETNIPVNICSFTVLVAMITDTARMLYQYDLTASEMFMYSISGIITAAMFFMYEFSDHRKSSVAHWLFTVSVYIYGFAAGSVECDNITVQTAVSMGLILAAAAMAFVSGRNDSFGSRVLQIFIVPMTISTAIIAENIFGEEYSVIADIILLVWSSVYVFAAMTDKMRGSRNMLLTGIQASAAVMFIHTVSDYNYPEHYLLLSAACMLIYALRDSRGKAAVNTASLIFLAATVSGGIHTVFQPEAYTAVEYGISSLLIIGSFCAYHFSDKKQSTFANAVNMLSVFISGHCMAIYSGNIDNIYAFAAGIALIVCSAAVCVISGRNESVHSKRMQYLVMPVLLSIASAVDNAFGDYVSETALGIMLSGTAAYIIMCAFDKLPSFRRYMLFGMEAMSLLMLFVSGDISDYPDVYMWTATACLTAYTFRDGKSSAPFAGMQTMFMLSVCASGARIITEHDVDFLAIALPALAGSAVLIAYHFIHGKRTEYASVSWGMTKLFASLSSSFGFISCYGWWNKYCGEMKLWITLAFSLSLAMYLFMHIYHVRKQKNNLLFVRSGIMMNPALIFTLDSFIGAPHIIFIIGMIAYAAMLFTGRFFNKKLVSENYTTDLPMLCSAAMIPSLMIVFSDYGIFADKKLWWLLWFAAAAYCFAFIGRTGGHEKLLTGMKTAGAIMLLGAYLFQPFGDIPLSFEIVFYTVGFAAFSAAMCFIYRRYSRSGRISFWASAAFAVYMLIKTYSDMLISSAVFTAAVFAVIMAVSFIVRRKRWLTLSVCGIVTLVLMMTAELWTSSSWWVYLMAAGVILIVWGIVNETVKRRKKEEKKDIFAEWKW